MAAEVVCIASFNADLIVHLDRPPARGETRMARSADVLPGGKGSNAAVAAARQGAQVAVLARLGDDGFADMAAALWRQEGIDHAAVLRVPGERTGMAQIQVFADGDNAIVVAPGAGAGLCAADVQACEALVQGARVVMASCEVPVAATVTAFTLARSAGAVTLLNPAPAMALPSELLAVTDLLTPNEGELQALTGIAPRDEAARALLAKGPRAVIVTLGKAGCASYRADRPPLMLPGHTMTVADTIGAGDCFTGALAAALARGEPIEQAMRCANAAAALSVTGQGALAGMPTREAVAVLLGS